jgi:hypothetical protein
MNPLHLPTFESKITLIDGRECIFDPIRKKHVVLTPEEWVRQHMVNFLVAHLGYPASRVRIEGGHYLNTLSKRTDLVVYDANIKPFMVVECKADTVALTQAAFDQLVRYNLTLGAPYIALTNGIQHFCFLAEGQELIQQADFPKYQK